MKTCRECWTKEHVEAETCTECRQRKCTHLMASGGICDRCFRALNAADIWRRDDFVDGYDE